MQVAGVGYDVTPEAVVAALSGRLPPGMPATAALPAHANASWLVYATGHGGDGFLKFHDRAALAADELAAGLAVAQRAGRYGTTRCRPANLMLPALVRHHPPPSRRCRFHDALLVFDTCQASTLGEPLQWFPRRVSRFGSGAAVDDGGFVTLASSQRGEYSYGSGPDALVGQVVMDGFTRVLADTLRSWAAPVAAASSPTPAAAGSVAARCAAAAGGNATEASDSWRALCARVAARRRDRAVPPPRPPRRQAPPPPDAQTVAALLRVLAGPITGSVPVPLAGATSPLRPLAAAALSAAYATAAAAVEGTHTWRRAATTCTTPECILLVAARQVVGADTGTDAAVMRRLLARAAAGDWRLDTDTDTSDAAGDGTGAATAVDVAGAPAVLGHMPLAPWLGPGPRS